jgi:hypothetical protein
MLTKSPILFFLWCILFSVYDFVLSIYFCYKGSVLTLFVNNKEVSLIYKSSESSEKPRN